MTFNRFVQFACAIAASVFLAGNAFATECGQWFARSPATSPSARSGIAGCYSDTNNAFLIFGGWGGAPGNPVFDDMWAWDGTNWSNITPGVRPPARLRGQMVYDAARSRVVLFGGIGAFPFPFLGDTWEFDGTTWQQIAVPGPFMRADFGMAYDPVRERVVLFGGRQGGPEFGDTWEYDGTQWIMMPQVGPQPEPRANAQMAWDPALQRIVLTGGDFSSMQLQSTWAWNGTVWQQLPAISALATAAVWGAWTDDQTGRAVFLAPTVSAMQRAPVSLVDGNWVQVGPAFTPTYCCTASGFDSSRAVAVVFGGAPNGFTTSSQTLELVPPVAIFGQPQTQTRTQGEMVELSVATGAFVPTQVQWRRDGMPLSNGGRISGAQTLTLTITNVQSSDEGAYDCIVSGADSAGTGLCSLTSDTAVLSVFVPPGACCFSATGACLILTEADCLAQLGNFTAIGQTCSAADCPQPPIGGSSELVFSVEASSNAAVPVQTIQSYSRTTGNTTTRASTASIAALMQIANPLLTFQTSYVRLADMCLGADGSLLVAQGQLPNSSYVPPRPSDQPGIGAVIRIRNVLSGTPQLSLSSSSGFLSNIIGLGYDFASDQVISVVNPGGGTNVTPRVDGLVASNGTTGAQTLLFQEPSVPPRPGYQAGAYIQPDPRGLDRTFIVSTIQGGLNSTATSTSGGPQLYRLTYTETLSATVELLVDFSNTAQTGISEDFIDQATDPFISGGVRGLAVVPYEPRNIYVGFRNSGIWRVVLNDDGSYRAMQQVVAQEGVEALDFDPYTNRLVYGVDGGGQFGIFEVRLDGTGVQQLVANVKPRGIEAVPGVIYVNVNAPAGGNGRSWSTAFRDIQDALDYARSTPSKGFSRQIWIARGTYYPDRGTGDRTSSFELVDGVGLYGGFIGFETQLSQRNFVSNRTILSADLGRDDNYSTPATRTSASRLNNARNIVDVVDAHNARLDGLVIQGAWGDAQVGPSGNRGGGVLNESGRPIVIANCTFFANDANEGAAIYSAGSPVIENCTFIENWTLNGGGAAVFTGSGSPLVSRSRVRASLSTQSGAGVIVRNGSTPWFVNTQFLGNRSTAGGAGAVLAAGPSEATFVNCVFSGNVGQAAVGGGAIGVRDTADALITGTTFAENAAGGNGDTLWLAATASATFRNSIVWGPQAVARIGAQSLHFGGPGAPMFAYTCVEGWTGSFGGTGNQGAAPRFVNARGVDGVAGTDDDQLQLRAGSRAIDAGSSLLVLADEADLNGNGDIDEATPLDLALSPRLADDAGTPDRGVGAPVVVDMGAYEFQGFTCAGDYNGDGAVDLVDLLAFNSDWTAELGQQGPSLAADVNPSNSVDLLDLLTFLDAWLNQIGGGCF